MTMGRRKRTIEYAFQLPTRWFAAAKAAIDETAQGVCQSHWQRARRLIRDTPVRQG
jgi:hypothetical protein